MVVRNRITLLLVFALLCSTYKAGAATVKYVKNPGEGNDITRELQSAVSGAPWGGVVMLPAGEFIFDGQINIPSGRSFHLMGAGKDKTKLFRSKDDKNTMILFSGRNNPRDVIEISGIWFRGTEPSKKNGDGKSEFDDNCLRFSRCVGFRIHDCRFQWFGHSAVSVRHTDKIANGLIYNNEFLDICKKSRREVRGWTTGYGVYVKGTDREWIDDPAPGGSNYIFVEDNYFAGNRHAMCSGGGGLYVFRHNLCARGVVGQAIDTHGGGNYGNRMSHRFFEVYGNVVINASSASNFPPEAYFLARDMGFKDMYKYTVFPRDYTSERLYRAMAFRGGEGVVFNNFVSGWRNWLVLVPEINGSYPVPQQAGYDSGVKYGANHAGIDPKAEGKGDVFIWNNSNNKSRTTSIRVQRGSIKQNRDYHINIPRPGYEPYPYPHPYRTGLVPKSKAAQKSKEPKKPIRFVPKVDPDKVIGKVLVKIRSLATDDPDAAREYLKEFKPEDEMNVIAAEILQHGLDAQKNIFAFVRSAVEKGARPTAYVDFLGTTMRGKVKGLAGDVLVVTVAGNDMNVSLESFSARRLFSLAFKLAADPPAARALADITAYGLVYGVEADKVGEAAQKIPAGAEIAEASEDFIRLAELLAQ